MPTMSNPMQLIQTDDALMKHAYKNNINESVQKVQLKCPALASFVKLVDSSIVKVKHKYLLKPSFIKWR